MNVFTMHSALEKLKVKRVSRKRKSRMSGLVRVFIVCIIDGAGLRRRKEFAQIRKITKACLTFLMKIAMLFTSSGQDEPVIL